ncbi:MAG: flagellar biosynthesis regulator FlaF [Thalassobaculum sp.]|uniref:flagellar biosynthesis regulator FlaF n=1 Tax=Thalassobaculum sp. TaxID=2022740 RepID=UPI0032EAE8A2
MSQYDAYKRTIRQTASPRDVEYRLLAQVTAALLTAKDLRERSDRDPRRMAQIMDALNWNNQVWDAFVEDVGTEGNMLPRELRAAIVSLGIWVTRETGMVSSGEGDIDALIAVNRAIMRGLNPNLAGREEGASDPQTAVPEQPA